MRGTHISPTRVAWLTRRIGLDANPLRRGSDRVQTWLGIGLVLVFLAGAPVAGLQATHWAQSAAARAAAAQRAGVRAIPATLLRTVPGAAAAYPYRSTPHLGWAPARWAAPDGIMRSGTVPAPPGARAGSTVLVWTDRDGRLTGPPLRPAQTRGWVLMAGLLAPVLLALILLIVRGLCRQLLEWQRMASWEQAWSAVEPQWTRRPR